jgi:hypothetical protein
MATGILPELLGLMLLGKLPGLMSIETETAASDHVIVKD